MPGVTPGEIIRVRREELGWSQEQLAAALGPYKVTREAVSQWEHDRTRPRYKRLAKLAEVLNIEGTPTLPNIEHKPMNTERGSLLSKILRLEPEDQEYVESFVDRLLTGAPPTNRSAKKGRK